MTTKYQLNNCDYIVSIKSLLRAKKFKGQTLILYTTLIIMRFHLFLFPAFESELTLLMRMGWLLDCFDQKIILEEFVLL